MLVVLEILELSSQKLLIKPNPKQDKTETGIFIPESAQKKNCTGEVLKISDDVVGISVGDHIIWTQFGGLNIAVDNDIYYIIDKKDIYAVIEDTNAKVLA